MLLYLIYHEFYTKFIRYDLDRDRQMRPPPPSDSQIRSDRTCGVAVFKNHLNPAILFRDFAILNVEPGYPGRVRVVRRP